MKTGGRKIISIALALCLAGSSIGLNTGCKKQENQVQNTSVKQDKINLDSVVMAVGDEKISFREIMFYVYYLKKQYESGFGKELWNYQMEQEKTIEDYVKEQIVSEVTEVKVISHEAQKKGYTLSAEEENEAKSNAADFLGNISEEEKNKYGFTQESIEAIYKEHILAQKTYDIICGQVNTSISDKKAKQITVWVLTVLTQGKDRNGKTIDMDDTAKKIAKKRAKNFLKEGKKSNHFASYAESNSDLKQIEYTFGKDNIPEGFGETAFTLKTGQYSDVVEGPNGYYIIYCVSDFDKEKTTAKKEEIIESEQVKLFQDTYTKWSSNYEIVVSKTLMNQIQMKE